jgi:hypothetical protein
MSIQNSAEILEISKTCKTCGVNKPLSHFRNENRCKKDGKTARCVDCLNTQSREWDKNNKEKKAASRIKWRSNNPDYDKEWGRKHPDKIENWREKRKHLHAEYAKQWRIDNPEKTKISRKREIEKEKLKRRQARIDAGVRLLEPRTTHEGRRCSTCNNRFPDNAFYVSKHEPDGLNPNCKKCASNNSVEYIKANKKRLRPRLRGHERKARYGLEPSDFYRMVKEQNGVCKICATPLHDGPRGACVDHCHTTGFIRGILCVKCNAGLGQFRDNPSFLKSAIKYLLESKGQI